MHAFVSENNNGFTTTCRVGKTSSLPGLFEKEKEIVKDENFCATISELRVMTNNSDNRKILLNN